ERDVTRGGRPNGARRLDGDVDASVLSCCVRIVSNGEPSEHLSVRRPAPRRGGRDDHERHERDRESDSYTVCCLASQRRQTVARASFVVKSDYSERRYSAFREAPVRRDTKSTAGRRGTPMATSSATAATAASSARASLLSPVGPRTRVTSPSGGSVNLA